jgi:hydroxyacylglutathione hydrolase
MMSFIRIREAMTNLADVLIIDTPSFKIQRIYAANSLRNYSYILSKKENNQALVIDPWDAEQVWQRAKQAGRELRWVMNTHLHADHVRGNDELVLRGAVLVSEHPWLERWAVPGHTSEHVVFYLNDKGEEHLFCGDTLFQAGVGNCKNGGNPEKLYDSICFLSQKLSAHTFLHVGHDYWQRNLSFAVFVEPTNATARNCLDQLQFQEGHCFPPPDNGRWSDRPIPSCGWVRRDLGNS